MSSEYTKAMWERELIFSSFVGREVAIPHGTDASRVFVNHAQVVMIRLSKAIDWDGEDVNLCFGIASKGDEHGAILANIAEMLMDDGHYNFLQTTKDLDQIVNLLNKESDD